MRWVHYRLVPIRVPFLPRGNRTHSSHCTEKARRTRHVNDSTNCTFHSLSSEHHTHDAASGTYPKPDIVIPGATGLGAKRASSVGALPGMGRASSLPGSRGDLARRTSGVVEHVDFGLYVDEVCLAHALCRHLLRHRRCTTCERSVADQVDTVDGLAQDAAGDRHAAFPETRVSTSWQTSFSV